MEDSIKSCVSLLDDPDIEIAVRVGDVYALLVNHFTACQDYQQVCSEDSYILKVSLCFCFKIETASSVNSFSTGCKLKLKFK